MKNLFKLLISVLIIFSFLDIFSQGGVGINNTGVSPNNSAMLDVVSSNKGLLIPRVALTSTTDATTITSGNVLSLLVFNSATAADVVPGYYYWDGTVWKTIGGDANTDNQDLSYDAATGILSLTNDGSTVDLNPIKDHDWYEVGGVSQADNINDDVFTQGRVGIGISNPAAKLHVEENFDGRTAIRITNTSSGVSASTGISVTNDVGFGYLSLFSSSYNLNPDINNQLVIRAGDAINNGIKLWAGNNTDISFNNGGADPANTKMIIKGNGNVGIGTVNPIGKLHVSAGVSDSALVVSNNSFIGVNNTSPQANIHVKGSGIFETPSGAHLTIKNTAGTSIAQFQINNSTLEFTNGAKRFNINRISDDNLTINAGGGSVGIGRTALYPGRLTVFGLTDDATANAFTVLDSNLTNFNFLFNVRNDGNVGVGTATPIEKLDVLGNIKMSSTAGEFIIKDLDGIKDTDGLQGSIRFRDQNEALMGVIGFSTSVQSMSIQNRNVNGGISWSVGGTFSNMNLFANGNLSIGGGGSAERLNVGGNVKATGSFISGTTTYADYVFEDYFEGESKINSDYKFLSLDEVEKFIIKEKHLPGVKSIKEVETKDGYVINLGETSVKNLEKIEELYLHVIEVNKKLMIEQEKNRQLEKRLSKLENKK